MPMQQNHMETPNKNQSFAPTFKVTAGKRFDRVILANGASRLARAIVLFGLFSGIMISPANAAPKLPLDPEFWQNPAFVRAFNGSYLPNSEIEPSMTSEDRAALVEIQNSIKNGKREDALNALKSNARLSDSAPLLHNLGNLHFELGNLEQAKANFTAAIDIFPAFRRAHRNLAFTYYRLDEPTLAEQHLLRAIELGTQDANSFGLLGYLRLDKNRPAAALRAYENATMLAPDAIEWRTGTAQALLQLERFDEAATLLNELLDEFPSHLGLIRLQANLHLTLGADTEAASSLETLHHLGQLDSEQLLLLGQIHLRQQRLERASEQLNQAFAQLAPPLINPAINTLNQVLKQKHPKLAAALLQQFNQNQLPLTEKQNSQHQLITGLIEIENGKTQQGITRLETLTKSDPFNGQALIALAEQYAEGEPDKALMTLQQATAVENTHFEALVKASQIQVKLKRYQAAAESLEAALKIRYDPDLEEYLQALQAIIDA